MSAPTPAPGDDAPREGFYPDPSVPGYVRYWNGAAWVPGTSRPAPDGGGAPLAPSASGGAGSPGSAPAVPAVEETGPHFFDEDPVDGPAPSSSWPSPSPSPSQVPSPSSPFSPSSLPADSQHGSRPEPASAWGADRSHQSGFGGEPDRRVSWGADPRAAHASGPAGGDSAGTGGAEAGAAPAGNPFVFRPPTAESPSADSGSAGVPAPAAASDSAIADEGTMTFRAVGPRRGSGAASSGSGSSGRPGFGAGKAAAARAARTASGQAGNESPAPAPVSGPQQASAAPAVPPRSAAPEPASVPAPVPAPASASRPLTSGHGGGQSSWAQQVHRLDGEEAPVAPWKPPVEDVFQAAARRQASARPAGLGKRLVARLLDTVVLGGVTALAAVPLGIAAADHINEKIDAAKLSGRTVTVWLLDGTTSVYLGIVLAVLLLGGVLCEVLPTAKWGRTLGKKLLGLEVRDIEGHDAPGFGAALRRWLVYSIPGVLVVGVVGVLWCLFDKPWRQCWHDKAAHTFVAG